MLKVPEIVAIVLSLAAGATVAVLANGPLFLAERIELAFAVATFPWALGFIWKYARDPWWRTWFGRSLMMIAVAVALTSLSATLYRLFGTDYWGRPVLLVAASVLTYCAMCVRTLVLRWLQASDQSPL